ncbi:MAG: hypothetical protein PHI12_07980 [Dehalococcoidales bacterium]|jgi:hypothetical protein|nr:hypothetical protein [Sphaerochaeta sp.]MDD5510732.1 hypothetical protein [Dehalococcoidales bacterium]
MTGEPTVDDIFWAAANAGNQWISNELRALIDGYNKCIRALNSLIHDLEGTPAICDPLGTRAQDVARAIATEYDLEVVFDGRWRAIVDDGAIKLTVDEFHAYEVEVSPSLLADLVEVAGDLLGFKLSTGKP